MTLTPEEHERLVQLMASAYPAPERRPLATFVIPGDVPSTPNMREHWAQRSKRAAAVKRKVLLMGGKFRAALPALLVIELVRTGARKLDGDNLQAALKAHRDAVAAILRIDDASPLVRWEYGQTTNSDAKKHGTTVNAWRA